MITIRFCWLRVLLEHVIPNLLAAFQSSLLSEYFFYTSRKITKDQRAILNLCIYINIAYISELNTIPTIKAQCDAIRLNCHHFTEKGRENQLSKQSFFFLLFCFVCFICHFLLLSSSCKWDFLFKQSTKGYGASCLCFICSMTDLPFNISSL